MDEQNTVKSINGMPVEDTEARAMANDKIGKDELTDAVNDALAQAKESGEFKGDKGEPGGTGPAGPAGQPGEKGEPGDDYVLTDADKTEIAEEAAALVDAALLPIIGEVV